MSRHHLTHKADLFVPPMDELCSALRDGLNESFEEVDVCVAPCPDLRPLGWKAAGLGGRADYVECGTVLGSMFNPARQRDVYTLPSVSRCIGRSDGFVVGSGAGSTAEFRVNAEWVGNAVLREGRVAESGSRVAYVTDMNTLPEPYAVRAADERGELGCIGNLLFTEGAAETDVVAVRARVRRASRNWSEDPHEQEFIRVMRTALNKRWPAAEQQVALGGVMAVIRGRTVTHVMPPYFPPAGAKPGKKFPDMKGWSEVFYYSDNELMGATTFLNHQGTWQPPGAAWRLDHTHFFTQDGKEAGHYHYDVDPEHIEYVAFLVPCETINKVDLRGFSRM